jgi:hypothetical protein
MVHGVNVGAEGLMYSIIKERNAAVNYVETMWQ